MLPTVTISPEKPAELLNGMLRLTIRLQVIAGGQAEHGPYFLKEGFPPGYPLGDNGSVTHAGTGLL